MNLKFLEQEFKEMKAVEEKEIKKYQWHIECIQRGMKEKEAALKKLKTDKQLQRKFRELAFKKSEYENSNYEFDWLKKEMEELRKEIVKLEFPDHNWINLIVENERKNCEQLVEFKHIEEAILEKEIYGEEGSINTAKKAFDEYFDKVINPIAEKMENLYFENGIEACDLKRHNLVKVKKMMINGIYEELTKMVYQDEFGFFIKHDGFWKEVMEVKRETFEWLGEEYFGQWVLKNRFMKLKLKKNWEKSK